MTTRWTRDVAQKQQLFAPKGREELDEVETPTHTLLAPAVAVVKEERVKTDFQSAVIEDGPDAIEGLHLDDTPKSTRIDARATGPDTDEDEVLF